jgi:dephospho-CoA kinase
MKIALTGGIACGKSLLSKFLNELGVETLDADDVVHEIIPDPAERRRIAAEVFADPAKRKELEAKIHPIVKERIDEWFVQPAGSDPAGETEGSDPMVAHSHTGPASPHAKNSYSPSICQSVNLKIAVIPLLFEVHWEKNFDIISSVVSKREKQIERMVTTRLMTRAEAEARLAAQLPVEEKAKRSHYVIHNDGSPEELKAKAKAFVDWLRAKL